MTEQQLIQGCKRGDAKAQQRLYKEYSPILFGVVRRYIRSYEDAEDVFVEGMCKVLLKIQTFREEGSFEGWMKRIMVNEALMFLRKRSNFHLIRDLSEIQLADDRLIEPQIFADEILSLTDQLPTGYRTVFNMYIVEGYKHREIAEKLGISINTSKSQLILAKKRMQELIKKNKVSKTAS